MPIAVQIKPFPECYISEIMNSCEMQLALKHLQSIIMKK